jgi:hypothetical protein
MIRKLMWAAWPAFIAACLLELMVFAMVDPQELQWAGQPLEWSRQGIYTAAFFVFWAASMVASGLTAILGAPPAPVSPAPRQSE